MQQMTRRKASIAILALIILFLTACTTSSAATEPSTTIPKSTPTSTPIPPTATTQPTKTLTPPPTVTSPPTAVPESTPTPTPISTATPSLRQLTRGGCCVQPFFSADGQQVLFIDKPTEDTAVGIFGVDIDDPKPAPELVSELIGFRNPDRTIVATLDGNFARFTNEATGDSWTVDTGGNWPRFSPDSQQIIWSASDREGPYDRRQTDIWLANLDGSNAELLLSLYGGGFAGWFPDGERVLLIGRDDPDTEDVTMFVYNLTDGERTNLFTERRLRGIDISPGGSWIIFYLTFADESTDNGFWVVKPDGSDLHQLDVPAFGAYQWRNDDTLLYIPMRISADESMQLWAIDAATSQNMLLTNPASLSFSIANGDWTVSPDGNHVIFVNSEDQNIWAITLP
jgi:Tol biopolymer transport system component